MRTKLMLVSAAIAMIAGAASVRAHHSFAAEFDANKPVKLKGTVTKIEWMNPHAYFYIDVKDASGKVETWGLEISESFLVTPHGAEPFCRVPRRLLLKE